MRLLSRASASLSQVVPRRVRRGDVCGVRPRAHSASRRGAVLVLARTVADTLVNAARVHGDITRQDLRYALRSLGRTPGFTITAIVVAALGIGATTATFIDCRSRAAAAAAVCAIPIGWSGCGRHRPRAAIPASSRRRRTISIGNGWPSRSTASRPTAPRRRRLSAIGEPERIAGTRVTGGAVPSAWAPGGARPHADRSGHHVGPEPHRHQRSAVAQPLWRRRRTCSGQTMALDDATSVIVGVMPPDFIFPDRDTDVLAAVPLQRAKRRRRSQQPLPRGDRRLKPGVTFEQARSEMQVIAAPARTRNIPKELADRARARFAGATRCGAQSRMLLWALVGASLCVLLIACTNLANLLMSRALARRTEFAVRAAVGASVDRLVRQMLTDSLLLAAAGGRAGHPPRHRRRRP